MESLESKLDRLHPSQRKEVEDFVDFLISRSGPVHVPDVSSNTPPILDRTPPALTLLEPASFPEHLPSALPDPDLPEEGPSPVPRDEPEASVPFHEIGGGLQDRVTHDYMDYGQFEKSPSPATEAVKKVRRKLIAREGEAKPHHLLDWVD